MPRKKESKKSSEDLANDVEAFLANGGEIQTVDHTANKAWRERKQPGQQHIPMSVVRRAKKHTHRWAIGDYGDG